MDPERIAQTSSPRLAACLGVALVALVPLAACDAGQNLTDLTMELPEGDTDARMRLAGIEVSVWDPSVEVCREIVGWRRAVCGRACEPPPDPRTRAMPLAEISLARLTDGTFEATDVDVPGDGPWEVLVRGLDGSGTTFLHGCAVAAPSTPTVVRLFRPWCDTAACAGQFHPSCPVEIDCTADPGADLDGLGAPVCTPLVPVLYTWEQDGIACDPGATTLAAPCRPARIECHAGVTAAAEDGVCPAASDPMCGGTLEADLDCDGRFPGPCGPCSDGETSACGTGACAPVAACAPSGTFGECVVPTGSAESCGEGDEDCDGLDDATDPDAFAACNAGEVPSRPVADRCASGTTCRCGGAAACSGSGQACCDGACVAVATSTSHCGRCGRACAPGVPCVSGMCRPPTDGGTCSVEGCNEARPVGQPRADNCSTGGVCRCGDGFACDAPEDCCGGTCVTGGTCDIDGGMPDGCVPATETCGEGDEDCDGIPDVEDPDALAACNGDRTETTPAASACIDGGCACGDAPSCAAGFACCDGTDCVSLSTDTNCGECGNACEGARTCVSGICE